MSNKRLEMLLANRGGGNYKTKISWIATIKLIQEDILEQYQQE